MQERGEGSSKIIKPDDGVYDVFCHVGSHVRSVAGGEGQVDGNTGWPSVFSEDMLATSLTLTAKQSCKPQARAAAARCMLTRCGYCRGVTSISKHSGVMKQSSRSVFFTESDINTLSAQGSFIPRGVAEIERRGKLGMGSARSVLASRGAGHETARFASEERVERGIHNRSPLYPRI